MSAELPKQETASAAAQEQSSAAEYSQVEQEIQTKRSELVSAPTEKLASLVAEIQGLENRKNEMFDAAHTEASAENQRIDQEKSEAAERAHAEAQAGETAATTEREASAAQQLQGVHERLGISADSSTPETSKAEIPSEMDTALTTLFNNRNDDGQSVRGTGEANREAIKTIMSADAATQEALAEKFHQQTIGQDFSGNTMRKMLGVYYSTPDSPFRTKLQQIESARLEASGYSPLK
jgi:hypothetical protein